MSRQESFWEEAGRVGYGEALFRSRRVERHVRTRQWQAAMNTARRLGLGAAARVVELGCGDGEFATGVLGAHYRRVDALDGSRSAIERAVSRCSRENVRFRAVDLRGYEFSAEERWDAAFLMGFLHHIKRDAPAVVSRLARVAPKAVVLEPNGDNYIRKLLEGLPSYRAAGEESFRLRELTGIFGHAGYRLVASATINLFPPFTPDRLFLLLRALESFAERSRLLRRACSTYVLGFSADAG